MYIENKASLRISIGTTPIFFVQQVPIVCLPHDEKTTLILNVLMS